MKNIVRDFGYALSLIPVGLTIAGNLLGGYFTLGNVVFTLVVLVVTDWLFKESKNQPDAHSPLVADIFLTIHVAAHALAVGSLVYGASTGLLQGGWLVSAVVSTGVNSGISGITVAHELIHRKAKFWQALGIWNLVIVNYAHFFIEHIKAHHKHAATEKDAATARYGETVYGFVARTVPRQFANALNLEAERLGKKNAFGYGLENFVVSTALIQLGIAVAVVSIGGTTAGAAYLAQSALAIFLLEITNYAQHYGLQRKETERMTAEHSWNSDNISSRFFLLELPRHSDHHYYASRPYQDLLTYDESPTLPTGYLGLLPVVLAPPLWFNMIHPILEKHRAGKA